jgi:hypothetical protein
VVSSSDDNCTIIDDAHDNSNSKYDNRNVRSRKRNCMMMMMMMRRRRGGEWQWRRQICGQN